MRLLDVLRVTVFIAVTPMLLSACGGNDGGVPDSQLDITPPDSTIISSPQLVSTSTMAAFDFVSSEMNSTFEVSLDGATFQVATSPFTILNLSDGEHVFSVRAIDAEGNVDASIASFTWTVTTNIVTSSCSSVLGDNTQNADGSTSFVRSNTVGSPLYRIVTTRQLADGTDVTMDYMVHEPTGTPKGIMVLIAGGGLNARIEGPADGELATRSSGNFVVRSAHRYQAAGYRVITIDRPSDFASFGTFNVDLDTYRNSMLHATDIATILKRENLEALNVFIMGTSRGSISAVAMNTLVAGISLSSPLTGGAFGHPIGSNNLPLSRIERPSHILLHTNDTCSVTLPSDARSLFDNLLAMGKSTHGNEVDGGFQDTIRNDVCGAFDFHGFNGIETCAVEKETSWADGSLANLVGNTPPVAESQNVNEGTEITLTATDADLDSLSYSIPYATTPLGGSVSTTVSGNVTYTRPAALLAATGDTFAFTVTDGKGGVSTAVVSVTFQQ